MLDIEARFGASSTDQVDQGIHPTMPPRSRSADAPAKLDDAEPVQLAERAAESLRQIIMRGELLPGQKIHQVEVARQAGVSRSPLREALRTLEAEGLVKYETNRGYVVARLRMSELAEIYRLRSLLEVEMVSHIEAADTESLDALDVSLAGMELAVQDGDFDALMISFRAFQNTLLALSNLPIFLGEVQRLWKMTDSYNALHTLPPAIARRIIKEHRSILRSLKAGDLAKVRELVTALPQINEHVVVGLPSWR